MFVLAKETSRQLPTETDNVTYETIHPSVLEQDHMVPTLRESIQKNPSLVCRLLPLEQEMKKNWPYIPGKNKLTDSKGSAQVETATAVKTAVLLSATREVVTVGTQLGKEIIKEVKNRVMVGHSTNGASGKQSSAISWLKNFAHESRAGAA